jgi:hypothetical protein
MNSQDLPPVLLFYGKKTPVNQMNQPSQSSKARPSKTRSRSRRKHAANANGVPQILLGQKIVRELRILARLASSGENPPSELPRLKKAA